MNRYKLKHRDNFYPRIIPNLFRGKCSHTYQLNDGFIPYEVIVKIGEVCLCCKEIVPEFPRFRIQKRYGHCLHSWSEEYGINEMTDAGTKCLLPGAVCEWCGATQVQHEDGFRWESLRSKALLDRIQEIKPLVKVGSKWRDRATHEVMTIKKIETNPIQGYEGWMCYLDPHPEDTHWYESPEKLAEYYEPV
jgi:hypothetical protein